MKTFRLRASSPRISKSASRPAAQRTLELTSELRNCARLRRALLFGSLAAQLSAVANRLHLDANHCSLHDIAAAALSRSDRGFAPHQVDALGGSLIIGIFPVFMLGIGLASGHTWQKAIANNLAWIVGFPAFWLLGIPIAQRWGATRTFRATPAAQGGPSLLLRRNRDQCRWWLIQRSRRLARNRSLRRNTRSRLVVSK